MLNKLYVLFIMFLKVCFSVLLGVGFRLLLWVFLMIFIILCYIRCNKNKLLVRF